MQPTSPAPGQLDDASYARFAWSRFWRIQRWMALIALGVALLTLAILWRSSGPMPWLFIALVVIGVWATIMMATALMGLMFLSSGTGHDHDVVDPVSQHVPLND